MSDWSRPDTAVPPPPEPVYPHIPAGPEPRQETAGALTEPVPAPSTGARLGVVAVVAALVGALAGGGAALVATTDLREQPAAAPAPERGEDVRTEPLQTGNSGDLSRVAAVAERVLPSVVQIDVGRTGPVGGAAGNGSGVVYRSDGYIVTNNHVVAGGRQIEVVLPDGSRLPARVIGSDPDNDLAVVKV
ncbi:MAG TPA: trypsin-like peptidase domain-containing protein, partial [Egibacteraceae bacterium]|nr:trypsin-like peptidase domain-containing protein [Egibacteraceae bacterium]